MYVKSFDRLAERGGGGGGGLKRRPKLHQSTFSINVYSDFVYVFVGFYIHNELVE